MPDLWGLASIVTKFALYLGVLTSVGSVFAATLFQLKGYSRATVWFAVLGIVATLLGFSLAGAMLTGDVGGMTDPKMFGLLWSTPVGTALALRTAGLGVLIVGLLVPFKLRRVGVALSVMGGVLALWSFVRVGHIPDRGSVILNLVLMFHLVAISVWIGILSPLRALSLDAGKLSGH
jgi:putative copper resistance protein D